MKSITKGKQTFSLPQPISHREGKINKGVYLASIFATNVVIIITLCTFQFFSWVKFIQYGQEVVYYNDSKGYYTVYFIISFLTVSFVTSLNSTMITPKPYRRGFYTCVIKHDVHMAAALLFAFSIGVLGGFFSPYMVLAFIHNPLQTSLTYLFEIICVLCLYFIFLALSSCCYWITTPKRNHERNTRYLFALMTCCTSVSVAAVVTLMAIVSIQIFTFDNYLKLENFILPLFLGLLSFIFFKPVVNYLKSKLYDDNKESTDINDDHNDYSNLEAGNASTDELAALISNDTNAVNND